MSTRVMRRAMHGLSKIFYITRRYPERAPERAGAMPHRSTSCHSMPRYTPRTRLALCRAMMPAAIGSPLHKQSQDIASISLNTVSFGMFWYVVYRMCIVV